MLIDCPHCGQKLKLTLPHPGMERLLAVIMPMVVFVYPVFQFFRRRHLRQLRRLGERS